METERERAEEREERSRNKDLERFEEPVSWPRHRPPPDNYVSRMQTRGIFKFRPTKRSPSRVTIFFHHRAENLCLSGETTETLKTFNLGCRIINGVDTHRKDRAFGFFEHVGWNCSPEVHYVLRVREYQRM